MCLVWQEMKEEAPAIEARFQPLEDMYSCLAKFDVQVRVTLRFFCSNSSLLSAGSVPAAVLYPSSVCSNWNKRL
jgi:hypothetical protein